MKYRYFIFTWKNRRAGVTRHNLVKVMTDAEDIGYVAKSATNIFCSTFGSLKYNDIIEIQEVDKENNLIGEPIKPMDETSIVPYKR